MLNNTVEVYIPINEDMLSQSSLMATSTFPVTNEQVRYTSVGGEQVIKSGTNAFQSYATTVIDNIAKTVIGGVVSKINPYVGDDINELQICFRQSTMKSVLILTGHLE